MLDAAAPEVAAALALIDARLAAQQRDQGVPGLSAGIVADQQLLWARGNGQAVLAPVAERRRTRQEAAELPAPPPRLGALRR